MSLLELMIAVGILGVGLIMVAAIFPVAITQHKENIEHARAIELINKAKAVLHSRFDPSQLWVDPVFTDPAFGSPLLGQDTPWYTVPMANLEVGATNWDAMFVGGINYADRINGVVGGGLGGQPGGNYNAGLIIVGLDPLSDRLAPNPTMSPFTDVEFMEAPNRFAWIGFYRRLASGTVQFAAAVCKQSRNDVFAQQNLSVGPGVAGADSNLGRRLPVPWRVTVGYNAPTNRLLSLAVATEGIGELAPRGSKIMIAGWVGNPSVTVPTGRVLTVTSVYDSFNSSGNVNPNPKAIEVLEDVRDLPDGSVATFDVWVFPPPVVGTQQDGSARFGKDSPLVEWKMNL